MRIFSLLALIASLVCGSALSAQAAEKKKKEKEPAAQAEAGGQEMNACGCYQAPDGTCKCVKKSKCGCPGECEPGGCEDKRRKEQDREVQEEVKRQQDAERKRNAELAKKREEMDRNEGDGQPRLRGGKPQKADAGAP